MSSYNIPIHVFMQILEHPLYDLFAAAAAASYKTSLRVLRTLLLVILSH